MDTERTRPKAKFLFSAPEHVLCFDGVCRPSRENVRE